MNIVYLGAPITVNLSVGQTIAVNTNGTVTVECVSGLGLTDGATIGSIHGSATYGPFSAVGVARITATVRDGAYEVSDGQPIPIDTALAASGQTVLDDASRAALQFSGVGVIGAYATADLLESAIPASGMQGSLAIVGAASPYDLYESDGSVWRVRGSKSKGQDFGSTSGARAINCAKGTFCALAITGSTAVSFTNGPSYNSAIRMTLNITNGGSNITWPAGTRWAGPGVVGSAPTLATTGTDKVVVEISNIAGTTYYDATYIGRVA